MRLRVFSYQPAEARGIMSPTQADFWFNLESEERLKRLERVAKLLVTSGRRARGDLRTSINALIDAQMRNEYSFNERFAKLSDAQDRFSHAQDRTDAQIKELVSAQKVTDVKIEELAASQKETDQKLRAFIDIVRRDRNGGADLPPDILHGFSTTG